MIQSGSGLSLQDRRKVRLRQVREQSDNIARLIRERVAAATAKKEAALADKNKNSFANKVCDPRPWCAPLPPVGLNEHIPSSPRQISKIRDEEWKVNKELQMSRESVHSKKRPPRTVLTFRNRERTRSKSGEKKPPKDSETVDKFYCEKIVDAENECKVGNVLEIESPENNDLTVEPVADVAIQSPMDDLKLRHRDPTSFRVIPHETLRQINDKSESRLTFTLPMATDVSRVPFIENSTIFTDISDHIRNRRSRLSGTQPETMMTSAIPDVPRVTFADDLPIFTDISNHIKNRRSRWGGSREIPSSSNEDVESIRHTLTQVKRMIPPEVPELPAHYPLRGDSVSNVTECKFSSTFKPKKHSFKNSRNVTYVTRRVCSCKPGRKPKTMCEQISKQRMHRPSKCPNISVLCKDSSYVKKLLKDGVDAYERAANFTANAEALRQSKSPQKMPSDQIKLVNRSQNTSPGKNSSVRSPLKKLEKSIQVSSSMIPAKDLRSPCRMSPKRCGSKSNPERLADDLNYVPTKESSENSSSSENAVKYSKNLDFNALLNHIGKQKTKILKEVEKITIPSNESRQTKSSQTQTTKDVKVPSPRKIKHAQNKHKPASTVVNAVSFEDLQIIIEVKKANKKIQQNITDKNGEIVESISQTDSSNEYSIRASKITSKKKIMIDNKENVKVDTSESTSYWSPPEKINLFRQRSKGNSEASSFDGAAQKVVELKRLQLIEGSSTDTIQNNLQIGDPSDIKKYIEMLLNMSKKTVENIKVDTSDVSTPGHSVIDISSNISLDEKKLNEKLKKVREFIKSNYKLLDELQSTTSDSSKKCITSSASSNNEKNETWKAKLSKTTSPQTSTSSKTDIDKAKPKTRTKKKIKNKENTVQTKNDKPTSPVVENTQNLISTEKPQEICDESYDKLTEQCVKKITDLNIQLDKVRKDKQLTLSGSNSSGENDTLKNIPSSEDANDNFVPILLDIPKPQQNDNLVPQLPPDKATNFKFQRDLSTIIEIDTPMTTKNTIKDTSTTAESVIEVNNKSDNLIEEPVNKNVVQTASTSWVEPFAADLKPFVSFKAFAKSANGTPHSSIFEESSSGESLPDIIPEMLKRNIIDKPFPFDVSAKTKKASSVKDEDVDQSIIDFENILKSIGMEWAVATFRKTGEALALSSSSSTDRNESGKNDQSASFSNLNLSNTSCGMSTLMEDLNVSANFLKEYSLGSVSKTSFDKYLEAFLKKMNEQEKASETARAAKINEKSKEVETTKASQKIGEKTQHLTSTPVKLTISASNSDSSHRSGDHLFNMEDDLSSVKNSSSSTDNSKTLLVPNVSLKFGKLFDSTDKSAL